MWNILTSVLEYIRDIILNITTRNPTPYETKYLNDLIRFYNHSNQCNQQDINLMIRIINGKSNISLRLIDWFIHVYVHDNMTNNSVCHRFYENYKAEMRGYTKKYFDVFRRGNRITFSFADNISITTSIGQLNFFKWLCANNIITYIEQHYDEIIQQFNDHLDMNVLNEYSYQDMNVLTESM